MAEYSDTVRDSATENASYQEMDDFQNLGLQYFFGGNNNEDQRGMQLLEEQGVGDLKSPSLKDLMVFSKEQEVNP